MQRIVKWLGPLFWAIGFFMVMIGSLIRGPALGIGMTIENPTWQDGILRYEFDGIVYHETIRNPPPTPPTIHLKAHYTTPLADWDSILLLGQDLNVRAADGMVLYRTDTTRLRLGKPAMFGFTVGEVADRLVCIGTAACLIGPILTLRRGCGWISALWVMVVVVYWMG